MQCAQDLGGWDDRADWLARIAHIAGAEAAGRTSRTGPARRLRLSAFGLEGLAVEPATCGRSISRLVKRIHPFRVT